VHFALTSPLTTGRIRGGAGARAGRYRPRSFSMAVRRDLFERAGGFPDMFYGEDVDLSLRIEQLGFRLVFAPDARARHARRRTLGAVWTQARSMGRARWVLMQRDPAHRELVYLLPPAAVCAVALLVAGALLWPGLRGIALAGAVAAALYAACLVVAAGAELRALAPALLAPVVFALQQLAYGMGFLLAAFGPRSARERAERGREVTGSG
jgi:hypothetical protein